MSTEKEVDIVISKDGTVSVDQIGWEGKACDKSIDDLLNAIGTKVKTKQKKEYYTKQKVKIETRIGS
jgi:hypothetical protein